MTWRKRVLPFAVPLTTGLTMRIYEGGIQIQCVTPAPDAKTKSKLRPQCYRVLEFLKEIYKGDSKVNQSTIV